MKKKININYDYYSSKDELSDEQKNLFNEAKKACGNAYAPYSNFRVGAALLLDNGEVIPGNNQENAAYPSGLCAERVALFAAKSIYPNAKILKLAIVSEGELIKVDQYLTPCGSCRQVMAEAQKRQENNFEILLLNPDDSIIVFEKIDDLLPLIFGK
jgi:cytidine deaminase